ncbi:MAG: ATP-binding protein [Pseudomonadota bacterium]|nr:ATP-binding protein [Pseudomonadota bacterium]
MNDGTQGAGGEPRELAGMRFRARSDQLFSVRELVRDTLGRQGCDRSEVDGVVLAVDEACANIIRHAYGACAEGDIVIQIFAQDDDCVIRLRDYAEPVDPEAVCCRRPRELRPGGLGMFLIEKIMDRYDFTEAADGKGNVLEMRKRMGPSTAVGA